MLIGELTQLVYYIIGVVVLIVAFDYMFGWAERKFMAKMQFRHGPTNVGKFGLLQNLADILKLISKEHIVPDSADKLLFSAVPPLILAVFIFLIFMIPFFPGGLSNAISIGLLVVFVGISFLPLLIFVGGWSSGNKFSSIGAERSVAMLVGYEAPLIIIIATVAMLANSFNLATITAAQHSMYYIVLMPIGFVVFFIIMLAELERPPFDLREADSELIAGWLTDISAPYYAVALFIDYTRMFLGSLLISVLFLGGWNGPAILPPVAWLVIKAVVVALFIIAIRTSLVRMRLDRVLRLGWLTLAPLAILNLFLTFILFIR